MAGGVTLEELQVVIEAQTRGFRDEIGKVQNEVKRMSNNVNREVNKIKNSFKSLGKFIATLGLGKMFVDSTRQAMKVEGAIQQIKRTMGESSQMFLKWAETSALAFNMSKGDAISYGAIYSNLISTFATSTQESLKYTTNLLKASSIIASGTGRTMEDVMERIRSGLLGNTEAIEDLGINVNVAMLQSTEAFKRFANGRSWDQLSFQTQQQIRLFAILEQTSSKFGNEVFNNTNSSLQQLIAVLKDVALNIGNAFLPILNVVLPILTSFAMALRTVTGYIAVFMQTLFGKKASVAPVAKTMSHASGVANTGARAQNGYNKALGKTGETAKKTAKEMKGLLGGFDEINSLDNTGVDGGGMPGSGGGAGGIGGGMGGLDIPDFGLTEEPDVSGAIKAAEKVKAMFKELADFISKHKEIILAIIAGLVSGIAAAFLFFNWGKIVAGVSMCTTGIIGLIKAISFAGFIPFVGGLLSIYGPALAVGAIIGTVIGVIVYLWQTSEEFRNAILTVIEGIGAVLSRIWNEVLKPLFAFLADVFMTILVPIAKFIGGVCCDVVLAIAKVIESLWKNILGPVANFLVDILAIALEGIIEIWENWKPTIELVFAALKWIWDAMLKPLADFIITVLCASIERWGDVIKNVINSAKKIFQGIVDFIVGVFTGNWEKALKGLQNILGGIFEGMYNLAKRPINGIIDLVNMMIRGLNKIKFPDWVPVVGGKGINIPQIPKLARGGIVDSAQIFMAGENGKEAVIPLRNNTEWTGIVANLISSQLGNLGSNKNEDRPVEVVLQVGTTKLGKVVIDSINKLTKQEGKLLLDL